MSPWDSPERVAKLHALWAEGLSTAKIGAALGVSKNSIISKAHRDKLPPRPSPIKHDATQQRRVKMDGVTPMRGRHALTGSTLPALGVARLFPPLDPHDAAPPMWRHVRRHPLPIPVGAVGRAKTCQWTECDRAPWLFCDAPSAAGYSWCGEHRARVFAGAVTAIAELERARGLEL